MPKFVYMVEFDWSTEDDGDKEIQLYSNYLYYVYPKRQEKVMPM